MKHVAIMMAVVLGLAVAWASAAEGPAKKPGDKAGAKDVGDANRTGPKKQEAGPKEQKTGPKEESTGPTKSADSGPLTEDQQKAAEIAAKLVAGSVDEALADAKAFAAKTMDDKAKTEALRVVAECLRKKGDWKGAAQAYLKLKDRFEKTSEDYARYEAIAQILTASPSGLYVGGGAAAKTDGGKTLADDECLKDAISRLATVRGSKLKSRISPIRRAQTPQQVVAAFKPVVDDAQQLLQLGTDTAVDAVKEVAEAAGKRLAEIAKQTEGALRVKLQGWTQLKKFEKPWTFTNIEKKEVPNISASCKAMAAGEKEFQETLTLISGAWSGAEVLRRESADRSAAYGQLASEFVVPPYTTRIIW